MAEAETRLGDHAASLARHLAAEYGGCAQTVFAALQDLFEDGPEAGAVFRAAQGLSGGVGEGDGACGAYAGAALMISYLTGQDRDGYQRGPNPARDAMLHDLHERFVAEHGSVVCHDLHRRMFGRPYDLRDPDDRAEFGKVEDACIAVMADTARMAAEIVEWHRT